MPTMPRSKRYVPRGRNQYIFLPTVSTFTDGVPVPTKAELTAGTDITSEIFEVNGFSTKSNFTESSDASTTFKGKLFSSAEADDSTISFNASDDGLDIRTVLTEGQRGYLVIGTAGLATASKGEVYEVIVGSMTAEKTLDNAALITVSFAVPTRPNKAYTVPAS